MALSNYGDQGSDERTAQLARVYDQEMDEPGDTFIGGILRFRELDERTDGEHIFRLLWDSKADVLPLMIEVFEVREDNQDVPVERLRFEASDYREAWAHPWGFRG